MGSAIRPPGMEGNLHLCGTHSARLMRVALLLAFLLPAIHLLQLPLVAQAQEVVTPKPPPRGQPLPPPSPHQQQFLHLPAQPQPNLFSPQAALTLNGNVVNAAINAYDPCRYFENVSDVQQLNRHEFVAFEQCLYYFLANRAQHQAANAFGALHPLATLPPAYGQKGQKQKDVRVKVGQITLQHFQLNEYLKDLRIVGYLELQWEDPRLTWDVSQFKVEKLQIHSAQHVWLPVLSSQGYETSLRNDDGMEVRKIEATSRGNVSAILSFALKTFCDDADFRHFPDDIYKCCYTLEPHFNQELIELAVDGLPVFTDPKYFRDYGWSMSGSIPSVNADPNTIAQLGFCINLQRASSVVKIELWVPTWGTMLIFLFSPLFGSIRQQLMLKIFLLLLQILTLQMFSVRVGAHLGSAAATPVIMSIHELAVVLNVLSIVFSLVVWVLMRIRHTLPPWGWLTLGARLVNRYLSVFGGSAGIPRDDPTLPRYSNMSYDNNSYYGGDDLDQLSMGMANGGNEKVGGCTVGMRDGVVTINSTKSDQSGHNHQDKVQPSSPSSGVGSGASSITSSHPAGKHLSVTFGRYQWEWNEAFAAIHTLGVTAISVVLVFGYLLIR